MIQASALDPVTGGGSLPLVQKPPFFTVDARDNRTAARATTLHFSRGGVRTPVFMPVGTQATVKTLTPRQIEETGARILLGNTYHLNLRPGAGLIREMGGLHRFMNWPLPILTDSGGFQVFSLAKLRRISDEGIEFNSHLDGAPVRLGPSEVMAIQRDLGSDIAMPIDVCPHHGAGPDELRLAVDRTLRWAGRCCEEAVSNGFDEAGGRLFGIVQGGHSKEERRRCAEGLRALDFPGYAVGGLSVGEPEQQMLESAGYALEWLPEDCPRYAMGIGKPTQLLKLIGQGVDMFDCVLPTRAARHGMALTPRGPLNLRNSRFREDSRPLVEGLENYTCRHFSRAYLRHLVMAGEGLGGTLLTLHNLHFLISLMDEARRRIESGEFAGWSEAWVERYEAGDEA